MHPQIAAFARLAGENTPPVRALEGQRTKISRSMHGFAFDAMHDEIVVTSPLAQAILVFRGGANGEEEPIRVIQGRRTQLIGGDTGSLDRVSVDPANNEILLTIGTGQMLVFDRAANGDIPPKRILNLGNRGTIVVDPTRNLLVASGGGGLRIFDRTASGDAKPLREIKGPSVGGGGALQVYPPKGWIVAGCEAAYASSLSICVWSIDDSGDVPPRYKIPVQQLTGYQPSGLALDPAHKEVIISASGQKIQVSVPKDGIMNAAITFSWPEIF
jgi:hypothetical protein